MFATCSATKVSMVPTTPDQNILRKWEFPKKTILPQNEVFFFQNTGKKSLFNDIILYHTQSHANSTFNRVKDTQIWPEKETNP